MSSTRSLIHDSSVYEGSQSARVERRRSAAVRASVPPSLPPTPIALRIEVYVDQVEEADARLLLVGAELLQVPGEQRDVAVGAAIGLQVEALGGVLGREKQRRPAPLRGAGDDRVGVGGADRGAVAERAVEQLVVGHRVGVDVAVGGVPEHGLVVEDVEVPRCARRAC
jgi:hypothetical protein